MLVRKGSQPNFVAALKVFGERIGALYGTPDEYEERIIPIILMKDMRHLF